MKGKRMKFVWSKERREYLWLAVIWAGALVFRAALASLPRVIRWDEPDYLWLGRNLLSGRGYTIVGVPETHYTPLFPLLAGGVYLLTGNPELGSAFWYVFLGALLVVPVYFLARRLYGRRVAVLSAALVAVFPGLSSAVLYWGTMTEPLFIFLIYSALWAVAVALERDKPWAYALAGGLLSLAYLARPEGIVWLASLGIYLVLAWLAKGRLWAWRRVVHLGLYLGTFILLAAPYAVYLYRHTGKWMATGKLSITYDIGEAVLGRDPVLYDKVTASLDDKGEVLWWSEKRFEQGIVDIFLQDPKQFVQRVWRNLQQMKAALFSATIFPLALLAPVVLGWFRDPWQGRRLRYEALLWFGLLPLASFLPFHIEVRFLSPALPALLIWLAAGFWMLGSWLAETASHWRYGSAWPGDVQAVYLSRWQLTAVVVLLVPMALYLSFAHVRVIQRGMGDLRYGHKAAGLWLREHTPPEASIMSRDLAVSLYAERGFVVSPRADYATYLAYARHKGATHLLVDEHELRVLRPHLAFLLDEANPPAELEPIYSGQDAHGKVIVYRIKD
jgi:4-amino-4-deoxy-L-arabinose transferase-like glycosyltransferase